MMISPFASVYPRSQCLASNASRTGSVQFGSLFHRERGKDKLPGKVVDGQLVVKSKVIEQDITFPGDILLLNSTVLGNVTSINGNISVQRVGQPASIQRIAGTIKADSGNITLTTGDGRASHIVIDKDLIANHGGVTVIVPEGQRSRAIVRGVIQAREDVFLDGVVLVQGGVESTGHSVSIRNHDHSRAPEYGRIKAKEGVNVTGDVSLSHGVSADTVVINGKVIPQTKNRDKD